MMVFTLQYALQFSHILINAVNPNNKCMQRDKSNTSLGCSVYHDPHLLPLRFSLLSMSLSSSSNFQCNPLICYRFQGCHHFHVFRFFFFSFEESITLSFFFLDVKKTFIILFHLSCSTT